MTELSSRIQSIVGAIHKRTSDAQSEKDRRQDALQASRVEFETLKSAVIRPVLVSTSELLARNRVASQVEERKNVTYQEDHIRLMVEPPERARYPGSSVLLFAWSPPEGVDMHCYYRGSNNVSEGHVKALHLRCDEVTPQRVEQILVDVIGQLIEPASAAE